MGAGWCQDTRDAGYVAVAEGGTYALGLPPAVSRGMQWHDARIAREQAAQAERHADWLDGWEGRVRLGLHTMVPNRAVGMLEHARRSMELADIRQASRERRELAEGYQ